MDFDSGLRTGARVCCLRELSDGQMVYNRKFLATLTSIQYWRLTNHGPQPLLARCPSPTYPEPLSRRPTCPEPLSDRLYP
jgi:hypothetical protein